MKKTLFILGLVIIAVLCGLLSANAQSLGGGSGLANTRALGPISSLAFVKYPTVDLQPSIGFHFDSPIRVRVDKIISISPFVTVVNLLVDNGAGYSTGVSTIHADTALEKPKVGQTFKIGTSPQIYTITAVSEISLPNDIDITFTPPLVSAITNDSKIELRTYLTQINTELGNLYYDRREYHEIAALLLPFGWGQSPATPYVMK